MRVLAAPAFATLREILAREVRSLRADPLVPVTIVVPRETARGAARDDLARRLDGAFGVRVLSWPTWVDAQAGDAVARRGGRRLGEAGFERLAARVLAELPPDRRGPWSAVDPGEGASRLLAATFADLFEGGFDAEALAQVGALRRDPWRRDLPVLLARAGELLEAGNLWDRRRVERLAASTAATADGPLLLFGFHDLTPVQRAIVARHAAARPVTLFVPGVSGGEALPGEGAAAALLAWARDAGATLETADAAAPPAFTLRADRFASPALTDPGPSRVQLAAYATESAEVRGIAGRILDEVAEGRGFEDFLVTTPPGGGPPASLFRRIFAKAGIPLRDAVGVPGSQTPSGRLARLLLRAAVAGRDERAASALEFAAPLAGAAEDVADAAEWFVRARDAVEAGARFAALYRARLDGEPADEVIEAAEAVAAVLGDRPLRLPEYAGAFRAALSGVRVRSLDGTGVLLAGMDAARGLARPVVFHAGLVRGAVRGLPAAGTLLTESLRHAVNERFAWQGARLVTREERGEERLLLARLAFETATVCSVLSFAERDRAGGELRNPSGLLLDLASARAGVPLDPRGTAFRALAPPRAAATALARPADATDADLARFAGAPPDAAAVATVLDEERARHLPRVWRAAEARWGTPRLGRYDGVLSDPRAIAALRDRWSARHWSASALESMANCPFTFLLRLLRLSEAETDADDYDPREKGSLFHATYEEVSRALAGRGLLPLGPGTLPEALALVRAAIARERARLAGQPALRRIARRATLAGLEADLATAFAREAHRPAGAGLVPERFELAFGGEPDEPPAFLDLADGRRIPLRGRIDRVDRRADGGVEIVDLKTGAVRARPGRMQATTNGKTEVRLQLPLYLHAVPQVLGAPGRRAAYWHCTADAGFEEIPYEAHDLARDLDAIRDLVAHLLERIGEGWFPCTPAPGRCCFPSNASACGPGVAERFWRKLDDPELAGHLARLRATGAVAPEDGP